MGYLLRLSQANGFDSLWSLMRRAGLEQHEFRALHRGREKFAAIAGGKILGCQDEGPYNRPHRLLGHQLIINDLNIRRPKVCIPCIQHLGRIEAHWDLHLMVGCPLHGQLATTACVACGEGLRWYRPGLARCHCGQKLKNDGSRALTLAEVELLQLIRTKVLRLLPLGDAAPRLPTSNLQRFELRELLMIIRTMGSCVFVAQQQSVRERSPEMIVSGAAHVLSDWPDHFYELLFTLGQRSPGPVHDIRSQFAPLYSALFRTKNGKRSENFDFLRQAFLDFVCNQWDRRSIDPKTLRGVSDAVPRRFVTRAELARLLHIDPRTLRRYRGIDAQSDRPNQNMRTVIDVETVGSIATSSGRVLRIRHAARQIGIPVEVLRALKVSGEFRVQHQLARMPGFHEVDIRHFQERFATLPLIHTAPEQKTETRSLRLAFIHSCQSVEQRVALLGAVVRGEVRILGQNTGPVCELKVFVTDLEGLLDTLQPGRGDFMTCQEAGETLKCEPGAVRALVANQFLEGRKTGHRWQISRDSLAGFGSHFVRVSEVAKSLGTSSRRLVEICNQHKIEVCYAKMEGGGTCAFVRRSTISLVGAKHADGTSDISD